MRAGSPLPSPPGLQGRAPWPPQHLSSCIQCRPRPPLVPQEACPPASGSTRKRAGKGYTWHEITDEERKAAAAAAAADEAQWGRLGYAPLKWASRGEPPPKGADGRFVRQRRAPALPGYGNQPPSAVAERGNLYLRPRPYYKSHPEPTLRAGMPAQLRAALESPGAKLTWASSSSGVAPVVEALLDRIGDCLCARARARSRVDDDAPSTSAGPQRVVTDELRGSEAFAQPLLGPSGGPPECMLLDADLVTRTAQQRHMWVDARGYLKVTLANISEGRKEGGGKKAGARGKKAGTRGKSGARGKSGGGKVSEWAHRLVTWAMFGPPPSGLAHPEVMHVCDPATGEGNPRCLNPQHMVWGERAENSARPAERAGAFGVARRLHQRGYGARAGGGRRRAGAGGSRRREGGRESDRPGHAGGRGEIQGSRARAACRRLPPLAAGRGGASPDTFGQRSTTHTNSCPSWPATGAPQRV